MRRRRAAADSGGWRLTSCASICPPGPVAVKFALERLRVAADWQVPVSRNAAEYAWLSFAGRVLPGAAPRLRGRDAGLGGFAMDLVAGRLWKARC